MRAWNQIRVSQEENRIARWRPAVWLSAMRERSTRRRRSFLLKDIEELQRQLEEADVAQRQLRDKYREATHLHREQRTQLMRFRVAEQLFEASVGLSMDDSEGTAALTRLLRLVMETVEAGGGILWLRAKTGNRLVPYANEGRINTARLENILRVDTLSPAELRACCETALGSAPAVPQAPFSRLSAQSIPTSLLTEDAVVSTQRLPIPAGERAISTKFSNIASMDVQPTVETAFPETNQTTGKKKENTPQSVALLILRAEETEPDVSGHVMCVVGVCDPRGQSRFTPSERERLQSLSRPLAAALRNVLQRVETNQQLKEMSLRHNRNTLPQHVSHPAAIYQAIVAQVMQAVPCENCTLFLLDASGQRLEARATQGRVVNLLDHIRFGRGQGVSGWVAAQGRPLHITDITQETNLLNVETIPPRVRSFLAIPLRVEGTILGVLNVSHARAHAFSSEHVRQLSALAEQAAETLFFPDQISLQAA